MEEIKDNNNNVLALLVKPDSWKPGINFVSREEDYIQVGMWKYNTDQKLYPHKHNEVKREVLITQEVLYVQKGKIRANFFAVDGDELVTSRNLGQGDMLICLWGGHGYEILEDGTEVVEIKNGPYVGAERDRTRIGKDKGGE